MYAVLYVHTCILLASAGLAYPINPTTCKGGEQIPATSAGIIVMPRGAGWPDGSKQQLNSANQVPNCGFLLAGWGKGWATLDTRGRSHRR